MTRKDIKHVHLSVHPPTGRVTLGRAHRQRAWKWPAPTRSPSSAGSASSRAKLQGQARETPRQFIERESHYLWGRRYLLTVIEEDAKPFVAAQVTAESPSPCAPAAHWRNGMRSCTSGTSPCCMRWCPR